MRALTIAVTAITLTGLATSPVLGQNVGANQGRPPTGIQPASATYTNPRFDPAVHGFHFRNTFKNGVYVGSLKRIETQGLCGGMSYAAMDYFYHPSYGVPADRETPPEGDVYREYIYNRLMDSWKTVAPKTVQALIEPDRSSKMFRNGLGNGVNFKIFRSVIDSNKLCNLLMIENAGTAGMFKAGHCHQVTGIGYCDATDPRKVRIHIYDNNYRDVEMVLVLDQTKELVHQRQLLPDGTLSEKIFRTYKCYWPDTGYRKKTPPNPADPKVVNDWSGRDLRRWTPRSQDLRSYRFSGANLSGTGGLNHSDFEAVEADKANFTGTRLRQCDFRRACLRLANLTAADLRGSTLNKADLSNASFGNANLGGAKLRGAYIKGPGPGPLFVRAALQDAEFDGAQLPGAQFTQAKASKTRFVGADLSSAGMRQTTLADCLFRKANLTKASFYKSTMNGCGFMMAKLPGTSFQEAAIANCRFNSAKLSKASFQKAAITQCRFNGAKLFGASFRNAVINTAHFEGADLRNADFSGANLDTVWFDKNTKLVGSKWRGVAFKRLKGLPPESVQYILQNR